MHHIVPHLQLVEVLDLLPLIELLSLFPLFFRPEDIRLRQHHELKHGIFKALVYVSVICDHLPGLHLPQGILRIDRRKLLIPQILRQTLGSGSGTGQQKHPIAASLESGQILHQSLEAIVIRGHVPCRQIDLTVCLEIPSGLHSGNRYQTAAHKPCRHLLPAVEHVHLAGQHIALLGPLFHALPKLRLDGLSLLFHPRRLLHKEHRPEGDSRRLSRSGQEIRQR